MFATSLAVDDNGAASCPMTQERTRRLAAVWFADIVGYTALSQRDERVALRIVGELQRSARDQCEARAGSVVKVVGDAVLAVFDSVDRAVHAAVATRDEFLVRTRLRLDEYHRADSCSSPLLRPHFSAEPPHGEATQSYSRLLGTVRRCATAATGARVWLRLTHRTDG